MKYICNRSGFPFFVRPYALRAFRKGSHGISSFFFWVPIQSIPWLKFQDYFRSNNGVKQQNRHLPLDSRRILIRSSLSIHIQICPRVRFKQINATCGVTNHIDIDCSGEKQTSHLVSLGARQLVSWGHGSIQRVRVKAYATTTGQAFVWTAILFL